MSQSVTLLDRPSTTPRGMTAIDVLLRLAGHVQGATPATLAAECGRSAASVRRGLATLEAAGLAEKDPMYPGRYRLGDRAEMLGGSGRMVEIRRLARPHLKRLHEAVGVPVTIHVNTGTAQAAIERYPYETSLEEMERETKQFGNTVPLRVGSTAKVILAFMPESEALQVLEKTAAAGDSRNESLGGDLAAWKSAAPTMEELREIRRTGYAVSLGERTKNGRAMSAPVLEHGGRVCAALCLYGARDLVPDNVFFGATPLLVAEAGELSKELGYG